MTTEDLNQVKLLSALLYTPKQVAEVMGLDFETVQGYMLDPKCEFYRHYKAGFYETDIKLRNSIKKLAEAGSSPAQQMLLRMKDDNENRIVYES